jgi:hypothetical protein
MSAPELDYAIKAATLTQEHKRWPTFDGKMLKRHNFLSASESTKCIRSLSFQKRAEVTTTPNDNHFADMPNEDFDKLVDGLGARSPIGYFDRGDNIEEWAVKRLRDGLPEHMDLLFAGTEQRSFYTENARVSGTPDGLLIDLEQHLMWIVEFKSVSEVPGAPKSDHVNQTQVNAGLIAYLIHTMGSEKFAETTMMREYLVEGELPKMMGGLLLYIDSSNYMDQRQFTLEFDQGEAFMEVGKKALSLFTSKGQIQRPVDLPGEGIEKRSCYFCKHKRECALIEEAQGHVEETKALEKMDAKPKPQVSPIFSSALDEKNVTLAAEEYIVAESNVALWTDLLNTAKDSLKVYTDTQEGLVEIPAFDKVVRCKLSESTRKGAIDTKALDHTLEVNDLGVSDDYRKASSTSTSFRVTIKG